LQAQTPERNGNICGKYGVNSGKIAISIFFAFLAKPNFEVILMRKLATIFIVLSILVTQMEISAEVREKKPYTIMIYMNGSDLESDFGLATDDLAELIDSGLRSQNANILILTGGTKEWQNNAIPSYECVLWEFTDGKINELKSMGDVSMGNPTTLRDFLTFSMGNYPAAKYGLIMWDHGGGSIVGFGHDENWKDDALTLLDMKQAFEEAGLSRNKLEFIGFDACLMATVEMAIIAADFAHVMIASEDLEPGEGWDYRFLSVLNESPRMSGIELGKVIVDSFMDYFGPNSDEILTLSVVDLSKVQPVMEKMGRLMERAGAKISPYPTASHHRQSFFNLSKRRAATKTFGEGSPRDNYADMVDIGHMAIMLHDLFPFEAESLLKALEDCVVYNRHNSDTDLWGLSTFYIFGGKSIGDSSLKTYGTLGMDKNYTRYLHKFFESLTYASEFQDSPIIHTELALIQPVEAKLRMVGLLQTSTIGSYFWPKINGHHVVMFPIATTQNARMYAIPAKVNDEDVDIIVSFSARNPKGLVLGSREIENVFQKGYDPILPGDEVVFLYPQWDSSDHETWVSGEKFTAGSFSLTWEEADATHELWHRLTDACGYTRLAHK